MKFEDVLDLVVDVSVQEILIDFLYGEDSHLMLFKRVAEFVKLGEIVGEQNGVGIGAPAAQPVVLLGEGATGMGILGWEQGRLHRPSEWLGSVCVGGVGRN